MKEKLRKVKFSLQPKDGFMPSLSEEELKEKEEGERERIGYFHGLTTLPNDSSGCKMAIVEDSEGKMHYVFPYLLTFIDSPDENR